MKYINQVFLRYDGGGRFTLRTGTRYMGFTEAAFLSAWIGKPRDIGVGRKGSKGIGDWLSRKGFPDCAVTPTAIRSAKSKHGKYVKLRRKEGGWGGARSKSGRRPTDPCREEFEEAVELARDSHSEAPYLRYEAVWEERNGRKAPKSLLKEFREALRD